MSCYMLKIPNKVKELGLVSVTYGVVNGVSWENIAGYVELQIQFGKLSETNIWN